MSGGHFDYNQYKIEEIADAINHIISINNIEDEYHWAYNFSDKTLEKLSEGVKILRTAYIYAHRIDWLVSGDDGEETFHERLEEELLKLEEGKT